MMVCPNCGFNSPPGMKFCGNCGSRLPQSGAAPGRPVRPFLDASNDRLHQWMSAERRERTRLAGIEAAGQRRNVTVLFADLSDYTSMSEQLDTEDVYGLINQFLGILVEAVYRYEGTLDKITGDGIMALFGAPEAYENNAERAARAALDMQADVRQFAQETRSRMGVEPRMRIGLHSGDVVVGGVGSDLFMQYTAIGDTVNLARRLEEASQPGTVLVSDSVYRATRPVLEFEPGESLRLKGIAEPVQTYRLAGVKSRPSSLRGIEGLQAPMIGREAELNRLSQAVAELTERRLGRVAVVIGDAGIGKSRLTRELKRLIGPLPVRVLEGSSLSYRRSISYWSFLQILRSYFDLSPNASEEETRGKITRKIVERLPDRLQDVLPYIEQLFVLKPSSGPGADRMIHLDPGQIRQQTFIAVRDLLVAEANAQPVVLVFEDLHWVDGASQDLLLYLLDSVTHAPILFYCISRPSEGQALAEVCQRALSRYADRLMKIELQSLSLDQSEQLTRELLALSELPGEFREQIFRRAAGNPFYLEELLRTLIDRQVIHRGPNGWAITPDAPLADHAVPDSLQGLILARFDRLSERERRTLQVAAIIGHEFSVDLLNRVLENEPGLTGTIDELLRHEFIIQSDGAAQPKGYQFKHVLTSETVYGTLLKRDRDALHGQVAETIEMVYAARLDEYVEMLAHHFDRSGNAEKALHYLIVSGEKAFRAFAIKEARGYFEQARGLLIRVPYVPDQKYTILSSLGDILTHLGEYEPARRTYQDAVASLPHVDPVAHAKRVGDLVRRIGVTFFKQGNYAEALGRFQEANRIVELSPEPLPTELAQIQNDMGWVHFQQGDLDEARDRLRRGLALVEDGTAYEIISSVYNRLGGISFSKGDLEESSRFVRKSLVLSESIGDLFGAARSFNNLGVLAELRGDWGAAIENFRRSLQLHERIGDPEGVATALGNIGLIHCNQGQYESAEGFLNRSLALARNIQHPYLQGRALLNLGRAALDQGRPQAGLPLLEEAFSLFEELNDHENMIYCTHSLGEGALLMGKTDLAHEKAHQAMALASQSEKDGEGSPVRARPLRLMGTVMRGDGDLEGSLKSLRESARIFEQLKDRMEQIRTLYELALTHRARGEVRAATLALTEARIMAQEIGAAGEGPRIEDLLAELQAR